MRRLLGIFLSLLATSGSTHALDGVVEINQVRALQGGITSSDEPGFPVTLSDVGSYRLTSDLDLSNEPSPADTTAITIEASHVTVDMNGFSILGPTRCTETPFTCSPQGSGIGIHGAISPTDTTIYNGAVQGMGSRGIYLRNRGTIENVNVRHNGGTAIAVEGDGAHLVRNQIATNGGDGLVAGNVALVRDNRIDTPRQACIHVGTGSIIKGNHCINGGDAPAIETGSGSIVTANVVRSAQQTALVAGAGTILDGNNASDGSASGIVVQAGALVRGNGIVANAGMAMSMTNGGYLENVFTANLLGGETQVTGGTPIGSNFCGSNTICP